MHLLRRVVTVTSIGRGRSVTCAAVIWLHPPPCAACTTSILLCVQLGTRLLLGSTKAVPGAVHAHQWDSCTKRTRCVPSPIPHSQLLACNNPIGKAPYLRITLGASRDCTSTTKVYIFRYSTNKTEMRKIYGVFWSVVPLYQSHCVHLWQFLRVESTNNHQMVSPRKNLL